MNIFTDTIKNWFCSDDVKSSQKDYLSHLPSDILKEMMKHLPLDSVRGLSRTERKIKPIADSVIPIKIQEYLENIGFLIISKGKQSNLTVIENYHQFNDEAKLYPDGSPERLGLLRKAVCMLFSNLDIFYQSQYCIDKDELLAVQLLKTKNFRWRNIHYSKESAKIALLYLNFLKTNQIKVTSLDISFHQPLDRKCLNALLGALSRNQSIKEVVLSGSNWNLLFLKAILKAITNNRQIKQLRVDDAKFLGCNGNEWWWEMDEKEKNRKKFNAFVVAELKNSFDYLPSAWYQHQRITFGSSFF